MESWTPKRPSPSTAGDHDVSIISRSLQGKRIALIVCGGIAAMKAPFVARAIRQLGANVVAFMTAESLRYVGKDAMEWSTLNPIIEGLTFRAEHLSQDARFDAYLVAPATYNVINKMRYGIADTPVTTVLATALGLKEKGRAEVLVAPTMHGDMHNRILQESLEVLSQKGVVLVSPRDAHGKHNLPDPEVLAAFVSASLSGSNLRNRRILVTAGSTPTYIDDVRSISNKFRGRLGICIARELFLRGADVELVLGPACVESPQYIPTTIVPDFESYKSTVLDKLRTRFDYGVFSAAVADYRPKARVSGKIPSQGLESIDLEPTEKVIDLVQQRFPDLRMLTFKFQLNLSHEDLLAIAIERVKKGHIGVIANRGEERGQDGEQIAHLVASDLSVKTMRAKSTIALGVCDYLELVESNPGIDTVRSASNTPLVGNA